MTDTRLVVCVNERLGFGQKSCGGSGSRALIEQLNGLLKQAGLAIPITEQVCLGRCEQGIAMRIAPGGEFFTEVSEQDLSIIVHKLARFDSENNQ